VLVVDDLLWVNAPTVKPTIKPENANNVIAIISIGWVCDVPLWVG